MKKVARLLEEDQDLNSFCMRIDEDEDSPFIETTGREEAASAEVTAWVIEDGTILCTEHEPSHHPYTGEELKEVR